MARDAVRIFWRWQCDFGWGYVFYQECLTIPAAFYCKHLSLGPMRVMWHLNHEERTR